VGSHQLRVGGNSKFVGVYNFVGAFLCLIAGVCRMESEWRLIVCASKKQNPKMESGRIDLWINLAPGVFSLVKKNEFPVFCELRVVTYAHRRPCLQRLRARSAKFPSTSPIVFADVEINLSRALAMFLPSLPIGKVLFNVSDEVKKTLCWVCKWLSFGYIKRFLFKLHFLFFRKL
jgi:hypothetical protein